MTSPIAVQQAQEILTDDRAHIETVEDRRSSSYVRVTIQDLARSRVSLHVTAPRIGQNGSRLAYSCTCTEEPCAHLAVSLFLCGPILGFGDASPVPPAPPPLPAWQRTHDD